MRAKIQPWVILIILLLLFVGSLIFFPRVVITFFLAFFLAFLIEPLVKWFEKKGATRLAAVITVFFLLSVLGAVLVVVFLPGLVEDLNKALTKLPVYVSDLQRWSNMLNKEYKRFRLPPVSGRSPTRPYTGARKSSGNFCHLGSLLLFFSQICFILNAGFALISAAIWINCAVGSFTGVNSYSGKNKK